MATKAARSAGAKMTNATTKNDLKRARSKRLVELLVENNPGMSLGELQTEVGLIDEPDELSGGLISGRTFQRWSKGKEGAACLEEIKKLARIAYEKKMLPPLRDGGLQRADIFGVLSGANRNEQHKAQVQKLETLKKKRAAAVKALADYAAALSSIDWDSGMMTFAASSQNGVMQVNEISERSVSAIADEISRHFEHRFC